MIKSTFKRFFALEAASGIVLLLVTMAAIVCENSGLRDAYQFLMHLPIRLGVGDLALEKSLSHWVNDGLMVIFFFLVGMEIKREAISGHLASRQQALLPFVSALGGMIVPASIFWMFDHSDPMAIRGWAIPTATDIAFALGVLSLVGSRVPLGLKVFLTALAIIDDLGAILIIALVYTVELRVEMLAGAAGVLLLLTLLNRRGVKLALPYLLLGVVLWLFILKSGIHATIAGVLLAFTIPGKPTSDADALETSLLSKLEHAIHPWVAFGIMPIFAFFNAGLNLDGLSFAALTEPIPAGITLGLFVGKQLGVFLATAAAILLGLGHMPRGANWKQLYGVSILAGIGFTMSLFVGSLAYADSAHLIALTQLGVITGSILSSVVGLVVLLLVCEKNQTTND